MSSRVLSRAVRAVHNTAVFNLTLQLGFYTIQDYRSVIGSETEKQQ